GKPTPEHHMGWMVNHVQVGDRVAVADHEVGRSAAVEPGQRGTRARSSMATNSRPSAECPFGPGPTLSSLPEVADQNGGSARGYQDHFASLAAWHPPGGASSNGWCPFAPVVCRSLVHPGRTANDPLDVVRGCCARIVYRGTPASLSPRRAL